MLQVTGVESAQLSKQPGTPEMLVSVEGPTPWSNTAGEIAIREKLVELHALFLGEVRQPNDVEINAAYDLLVETWQGRLERFPGSGSVWYWPDDNCHMPGDYWELDEAVQAAASSDPIQMVGSWVSVLMYLMTHYSYLHE